MKTVVYQSYRTQHVQGWIAACMGTVRQWAAANSFDYEFIDDSLFDRVPPWYRARAGGEMCPVVDLARLVVAREFLAKGYERTVWVDADVLVFAPERLRVDEVKSFAFCHEVWLGINGKGAAGTIDRVNNAIAVFAKGNVQLEFFIDACLRIARANETLQKISMSTAFLTNLRAILPFPLLENVGLFSPPVMRDIANGTRAVLPTYAAALSMPLACANLCASLHGKETHGVVLDEAAYEAVVARCLESKGDVVNALVARPGARAAD